MIATSARIMDPGNLLVGLNVIAQCPTPGCDIHFVVECVSRNTFSGRPYSNPNVVMGCPTCQKLHYAHYEAKTKTWSMRPYKEGAT